MSAESTTTPDAEAMEGDLNCSMYCPPPQKSIEELLATDVEDESLRRYKETLLGEAKTKQIIIGKFAEIDVSLCSIMMNSFLLHSYSDEKDSRKVIVKKLHLLVDGRKDMELDLTGDLNEIKKQVNFLFEV